MDNEIISYIEMCQREGASLQRGMNYHLKKTHSVLLMSQRQNAPYKDQVTSDGTTLIYEGHDVPRSKEHPTPKLVDQPELTPNGRPTQNGLFHLAAQEHKAGLRNPDRVRVYEKIKQGIWSYNGVFHLVDSWLEGSGDRVVFKFQLEAVEGEEDLTRPIPLNPKHRRIIPTWVKLEVWKRDEGKCTQCGSSNDLHFDHILPWSKGGSSNTPENVQLLCGKHNLQKHDKIQ